MSMKCGHCKERHDTADEVYICGSKVGFRTRAVKLSEVKRAESRAGLQPDGQPVVTSGDHRTVKPSEERRVNIWAEIAEVRRQINPGRYAIRNQTGPNDISFYKVTRPEKGKWAGKTFIVQVVSESELRLTPERQLAAYVAILSDVREALRLYGQKIGVCGHCGLTLTNEESRRYGIGPVCRKNLGYTAA